MLSKINNVVCDYRVESARLVNKVETTISYNFVKTNERRVPRNKCNHSLRPVKLKVRTIILSLNNKPNNPRIMLTLAEYFLYAEQNTKKWTEDSAFITVTGSNTCSSAEFRIMGLRFLFDSHFCRNKWR